MNHPYRTNATPYIPPPPKKPFLCRIGLHFWGGWALDGCSVFFCTRCERHFICRPPKNKDKAPPVLFSRQLVGVIGPICEGWMLGTPCRRRASMVVTVDDHPHLLCDVCTARAKWEEGPETVIVPMHLDDRSVPVAFGELFGT